MNDINLSVVIPCYNEEKNIPQLVERFENIVLALNNKIEVIFVNNGSTDNSEQLLSGLCKGKSFFKIVTVPINKGYGYGILSGLAQGEGEYLGWTHADLQTDPEDLIKCFNIIKKSNFSSKIFIKGKRRGRKITDSFFTLGMSIFETIYLGKFLFDINAQPTVFHNSFYKMWFEPPNDFSLDLYAYYMAKRKNLKIIRFDVLFPPRIHGKSSWNIGFKARIKFIKRTLAYSKELKRKLKKPA